MDKLVKSLPCVPEVRKRTEFFVIFYFFFEINTVPTPGMRITPPPPPTNGSQVLSCD